MIGLLKKGMQILDKGFAQYEQLRINDENEYQAMSCGALNPRFLARIKRTEVDNSSVQNSENKDAGQRQQDVISLKESRRKSNLDRRVVCSDRRSDMDSNYKGISRRYTIDRRLNIKDRRDKG